MKIAILCLQGLGDALMMTPAISVLRAALPRAELHAIALRTGSHALLDAHPAIDRAHLAPFWDTSSLAAIRALPAIRREHFDVSILAYPTFRYEYHLFSIALGAKVRIAHDYRPFHKTLGFLENRRVAICNDHNVVNNVRLLAPLGIDLAPPPAYTIPAQWIAAPTRSRSVGFHVGTMTHKGNENKRWPLERFIDLARATRNLGYDITFISGPLERDLTALALAALPGSARIEGPLDHVARELSGLAAVVAADNGIAHLCAAVGTPIVALFGMTDPRHVRPWGSATFAVRPSDCPPCFHFGDALFECKLKIGFRCLQQDLQVEDAFAALRVALGPAEKSSNPG